MTHFESCVSKQTYAWRMSKDRKPNFEVVFCQTAMVSHTSSTENHLENLILDRMGKFLSGELNYDIDKNITGMKDSGRQRLICSVGPSAWHKVDNSIKFG